MSYICGTYTVVSHDDEDGGRECADDNDDDDTKGTCATHVCHL